MSDIFHKSCYTTRSSGYKYRTLSTNTGEKKHRDSNEDNTFDTKLKELKREMSSRIIKEVNKMSNARQAILDKFNKIDGKIDSMLEIQETVTGLRNNLQQAEISLSNVVDKVYRIEVAMAGTERYSLQSRKSSSRSQPPVISEEKELSESTINHN